MHTRCGVPRSICVSPETAVRHAACWVREGIGWWKCQVWVFNGLRTQYDGLFELALADTGCEDDTETEVGR